MVVAFGRKYALVILGQAGFIRAGRVAVARPHGADFDDASGEFRLMGRDEQERLRNAFYAGKAVGKAEAQVADPEPDNNLSPVTDGARCGWSPPPGLSPSLARRLQGE